MSSSSSSSSACSTSCPRRPPTSRTASSSSHTEQRQQTAPAAAPAPAAAAAPAVNAKTIVAPAETETVVENELYRITFSNHGAQVTSWILKKYKDAQGQPLDLVHADTAAKFGYPLSLYTYDAGLTAKLSQPLYVASATGTLNAPGTLSFHYADGNGLEVDEDLHLRPELRRSTPIRW